ncbi:hypothetical protein IW254_001371 [Corynebacterium aquatimens]|uniref:Long Rib domain-containing protein n=1 Tax=Corynebacterium aquatimens TaxID=1190508 RepID=A0A931DXZ3_9CORY|nr:hypothetical protein [Corynebacterium aquatimens]
MSDLLAGTEFALVRPDGGLRGWLVSVNRNTGEISAIAPTADAKPIAVTINVSYIDGSQETVDVTVGVTQGGNQAAQNEPEYEKQVAAPGTQVTVKPVGGIPAGSSFEMLDARGLDATVDKKSGALTVTLPANAKPGVIYTLQTRVTYADGSSDIIPLKVEIDSQTRRDATRWPNLEVPRNTLATYSPENKAPSGTTYGVAQSFNQAGWSVAIDPKSGDLSVTTASTVNAGETADVPVVTNYPDGSQRVVRVKVKAMQNHADTQQPAYPTVDLNPGKSTDVSLISQVDAAFGLVTTVEGVRVKIDPQTGTMTITADGEARNGVKHIPVRVYYKDGSVEEILASVRITSGSSDPSSFDKESSNTGSSKGTWFGVAVGVIALIAIGAFGYRYYDKQIRDFLRQFGIRI